MTKLENWGEFSGNQTRKENANLRKKRKTKCACPLSEVLFQRERKKHDQSTTAGGANGQELGKGRICLIKRETGGKKRSKR